MLYRFMLLVLFLFGIVLCSFSIYLFFAGRNDPAYMCLVPGIFLVVNTLSAADQKTQ